MSTVSYATKGALCGYVPKRKTWRAEEYLLTDTVTCRKCEAAVGGAS